MSEKSLVDHFSSDFLAVISKCRSMSVAAPWGQRSGLKFWTFSSIYNLFNLEPGLHWTHLFKPTSSSSSPKWQSELSWWVQRTPALAFFSIEGGGDQSGELPDSCSTAREMFFLLRLVVIGKSKARYSKYTKNVQLPLHLKIPFLLYCSVHGGFAQGDCIIHHGIIPLWTLGT